jgi:hypothetical protein
MAEMLNVYIGPCADWLIPRDRVSTVYWDHPILEELGSSLECVLCGGEFPVVTRDEREYVRFAFYPREHRDGFPDRELYFGSWNPWTDVAVELSGVDRKAEVRWFAKAYKAELKRLATHFGSKPELNWSLHAWMS